MASVAIILRREKQKKDKSFPLAVRIIKDRKPKYLHIGYSIFEKDWDSAARRVKKTHPNSARLNNLLLKKLAEANNIAIEAETNHHHVSSKEIKTKVARNGKSTPFFQFAVERIKGKYVSGVYSVAKSERSLLCNIAEFVQLKKTEPIESAKQAIADRRRKRISEGRRADYSFLEALKALEKNDSLRFEDINEMFINQFKIFCISYLEMKTRSITNHLIFIRTLFNTAMAEKIVDPKYYPFAGEKEKIRITSGHKIGLTREEVTSIEGIELKSNSQLWHTRNVWLLAYYFAGIRITDVLNLTWGDFKDGRLFYIMDKNEKPVSLKIPDKAAAILKGYKTRRQTKNDFVFPHMKKANRADSLDMFVKARNATSLLNKYLKRLAKLCGVNKDLSNHIARHTFGNLAGDKIHPLMLQKLYRHSDLKTTLNYQANFIHKEADEALDSVINF